MITVGMDLNQYSCKWEGDYISSIAVMRFSKNMKKVAGSLGWELVIFFFCVVRALTEVFLCIFHQYPKYNRKIG